MPRASRSQVSNQMPGFAGFVEADVGLCKIYVFKGKIEQQIFILITAPPVLHKYIRRPLSKGADFQVLDRQCLGPVDQENPYRSWIGQNWTTRKIPLSDTDTTTLPLMDKL